MNSGLENIFEDFTLDQSGTKFLKRPMVSLILRSVFKSITALSIEVVLLFAIGITLFAILSLFSREINFDLLFSLFVTGIFVIFLFFGVFVFFLTPIDIVLGVVGGIVLASLLHFTKVAIKDVNSRKMLAAFFGGVIVGIAGHLNLLFYDYFSSTNLRWEYVDLIDTFWGALANAGNNPMVLWPIIMIALLVILPSFMGINIGLNLASQLDK